MTSVVRLSTIGFVIITALFVLHWPFLAATDERPDRNGLAAANTPRVHRLSKRQFGVMGLGNFGSFAATAETPDRNSLAAANTPRIHRLTKRQFGGRGRGMGLGNFGSFGHAPSAHFQLNYFHEVMVNTVCAEAQHAPGCAVENYFAK